MILATSYIFVGPFCVQDFSHYVIADVDVNSVTGGIRLDREAEHQLQHISASAPGKVCSCRVVGAFAWSASSACSSLSTCSHSAFSSAVHPLQQWATKSHK